MIISNHPTYILKKSAFTSGAIFSHAWYYYGTSLTKIGKYDDATLMCFDKDVELDPSDSEACNDKGAILTHLGRNKDAFDCDSRVTESNPGPRVAWQNIGLLYEREGNKKAAKECFARAKKAGL